MHEYIVESNQLFIPNFSQYFTEQVIYYLFWNYNSGTHKPFLTQHPTLDELST